MPEHKSLSEGRCVLICAPFRRDGDSIATLLSASDDEALTVANLGEVARAIGTNTGVVVLTEEALQADLTPLATAVQSQDPWSDVPFILLLARQTSRNPVSTKSTTRLLSITSNVVILERPLGARALISAVKTALRSRARQFLLRDRMSELANAAELLEARVKERTAELQAEMAARERAEAALRQSQKMEAIGQLTGGIAHDFNNMLQGILGAIALTKRRLASGRAEEVTGFLDAGTAAAQRAAALTQRLLAFSRRQSLEAKSVEVNGLVKSLEEFLRRSMNEEVAVKLVTRATMPVKTDANQLETAIINLAVNARDAMPAGGVISIEADDVHLGANDLKSAPPEIAAGHFVRIAVSDTGVGMERGVIERAFDPFFTTKPLGSGTGLGLSMVYGFARQSGGWAEIVSHPGAGTVVSIFLPVTDEKPEVIATSAPQTSPSGSGQRVLVVDDEEAVRMIVKEVLTDLGYSATEAADPYAALSILTSGTKVDLLISDVGMPGMNGRELAETARKHRPELPILFITGYAENAAIRASFLGTNMDLISKPFALEELSAKIVEMVKA